MDGDRKRPAISEMTSTTTAGTSKITVEAMRDEVNHHRDTAPVSLPVEVLDAVFEVCQTPNETSLAFSTFESWFFLIEVQLLVLPTEPMRCLLVSLREKPKVRGEKMEPHSIALIGLVESP